MYYKMYSTHSDRNTVKRFMKNMFQTEKYQSQQLSKLTFAFFALLILAAIITVVVLLSRKKKDDDKNKKPKPPTPLM